MNENATHGLQCRQLWHGRSFVVVVLFSVPAILKAGSLKDKFTKPGMKSFSNSPVSFKNAIIPRWDSALPRVNRGRNETRVKIQRARVRSSYQLKSTELAQFSNKARDKLHNLKE